MRATAMRSADAIARFVPRALYRETFQSIVECYRRPKIDPRVIHVDGIILKTDDSCDRKFLESSEQLLAIKFRYHSGVRESTQV